MKATAGGRGDSTALVKFLEADNTVGLFVLLQLLLHL